MLATCTRWTIVAVVAMAVCRSGEAQRAHDELSLTIRLDDTDVFEGQPVTVLVQLVNNGRDTAWVAPLGLGYDYLQGIVTRAGIPVPQFKVWLDGMVSPNWRGVPLGPGESFYEPISLLRWWGEEGPLSSTFIGLRRLPPGSYVVRACYRSNVTRTVSAICDSVSLAVASRDARQEALFTELVNATLLDSQASDRVVLVETLLAIAERADADEAAQDLAVFAAHSAWTIARATGVVDRNGLRARLTNAIERLVERNEQHPRGALLAVGQRGIVSRASARLAAGSGTLADSVASAVGRGPGAAH